MLGILLLSGPAQADGWETMESGTTETLIDVWGASPTDVFAVGRSGTILRYDGNTWSAMPSPTTEQLTGVWGSSGNNVYAVGDNETILRYNGATWETIPCASSYQYHLNAVWGSGPNDVYAVGQAISSGKGVIIRWDGSNCDYREVDGPFAGPTQFNDVWGRSSNEVYVVGHNGVSSTIRGVAYAFNGTNWQWKDATLPITRSLYGIWGPDGSDELFAAAISYGGGPWNAVALRYDPPAGWDDPPFEALDSHAFLGVSGIAEDDVYVVGYDGTIVHYDGSVWSPMASGTTKILQDVWMDASGEGFAVGADGTILHVPVPSAVVLGMIGVGMVGACTRKRRVADAGG